MSCLEGVSQLTEVGHIRWVISIPFYSRLSNKPMHQESMESWVDTHWLHPGLELLSTWGAVSSLNYNLLCLMGLFIFSVVFLEACTVPGSQKTLNKYMLNK